MFYRADKSSCIRTGRVCQGYSTPKPPTPVRIAQPRRTLAPALTVHSATELHALEVFFIKTAPQLAGYFEHDFFRGCVLQLSLAEPTIRDAISALGMLHERTTRKRLLESSQNSLHLPMKLYNRAIRAIIDKVSGVSHDIQLVAMVNILFICFEYFQGNLHAAASHITGGINLLNNWRVMHQQEARRPWGQQYTSVEANFMERQVAPLLSLFNINAFQWGVDISNLFLLNPLDEQGRLILSTRFELLSEARVALMDLITITTWHFQQLDLVSEQDGPSEAEASRIHNLIVESFAQWGGKFDDLIERKERNWNESERRAADSIFIMRHGLDCEIASYYELEAEDFDWDINRRTFDSTVGYRLDNIASDTERFSDELSRSLSLDFGMIFPLHGVAWRSKWPHLHRRGFDLRSRLPQLASMPNSSTYNSISRRMVELEDAHLDWTPEQASAEGLPPPSRLRIHDFSVAVDEQQQGRLPVFAVTFWSKPDGPKGPWYFLTEHIHLGPGVHRKEATTLITA